MASKKRSSRSNCRPSFHISEAGHLLATKGSSKAGKTLSTEGKAQKRKRIKKGCLNGVGGTFKLTAKQKNNLPKSLQKAIIEHHRRLGKKIID